MLNQHLGLGKVLLYLALNFSSIGPNHERNPSRRRNTSLGLAGSLFALYHQQLKNTRLSSLEVNEDDANSYCKNPRERNGVGWGAGLHGSQGQSSSPLTCLIRGSTEFMDNLLLTGLKLSVVIGFLPLFILLCLQALPQAINCSLAPSQKRNETEKGWGQNAESQLDLRQRNGSADILGIT